MCTQHGDVILRKIQYVVILLCFVVGSSSQSRDVAIF